MDRREILVLKPDAVIRRTSVVLMDEVFPILGKMMLRQKFYVSIDAINYAIRVKQRYLQGKEYECTNPPTT